MLFAASFGAALCLRTVPVNAQSVPSGSPVPGRALLDFPLGTVGEIPALSNAGGGGLFNPAAILPLHPVRLSAAVAALSATETRGVDGQVGTVVATRGLTAFGVGLARMSVGGLDRTGDSDPTVLGSIPYYTSVASLLAAHRFGGAAKRRLVVGAAARYRSGTSDTVTASTGALDFGVMADHLGGHLDLRVAAATYLLRPFNQGIERPGLHLGADARVAGPDDAQEVRMGLATDVTRGATRETGLYASGRWRFAEARAAVAKANDFQSSQTRTRLGVAFRGTRFAVGVAHEGSDPGFGSIWQFSFSTQIR
ncbi:hypothetical protein [Gemmatirosa kalamazoonensis]|nr:hypothetical protein [Gemmatirosa kalamazoonensis]